jgi:Glycosyltransferase family 87
VTASPSVAAVPRRISWEGLSRALARVGLPFWFLASNVIWLTFHLETIGVDARQYHDAAQVWLAGGDPWSLVSFGVPFGAAPPTLLVYAPLAWLPDDIAVVVWMVAGFGATLWILNRLHLPLWWLLFPPVTMALAHGNAQPIALALLLVEAPWATTLATATKLYAIIPPVVRRDWRGVTVVVVLLLCTIPVLPWGQYLAHREALLPGARVWWNGSAWAFPWLLVPPTALALWILKRRGAEWFAIPALWPATQPYYTMFVMPAIRSPWLAAFLAVTLVPVPALATIGYAATIVLGPGIRHFWKRRKLVDAFSEGSPSTTGLPAR